MEIFTAGIGDLKSLVIAICVSLGAWGAIILMEGYCDDNLGDNAYVS